MRRRHFIGKTIIGTTGVSLGASGVLTSSFKEANDKLEGVNKTVTSTEITLLILPEVNLPREEPDYDVRNEYYYGAGNLHYCQIHLKKLCRNMGISVKRTEINGLKDLGKTILLVPDATVMLPETVKSLEEWIAKGKPVIFFGEIPQRWAFKNGIHVLSPRSNKVYNSIYFTSDNLSIPATLSNYTSYISDEPVALLTDPNNTNNQVTFVCRKGSVMFCGWIPRTHSWEVIDELDQHRFFARLLKEFDIEVDLPNIPDERIGNLKSFADSTWGFWPFYFPIDQKLADYGFDHFYLYGSYLSGIIARKFREKLTGVSLMTQMESVTTRFTYEGTNERIKEAQNSGLKVHSVIVPFPIYRTVTPPPSYENELLKHDGLQYRYTDDVLTPTSLWSPANQELKQLAVESLREYLIQQKVDGIKMDGIFIDFARYLDGNLDYGPSMRKLFEKQIGRRINNWPKDIIDDPDLKRSFNALKREVMSNFMIEFGLAAKEIQKDIVIEALYYWDYWPEKGGAYENIGQDPKLVINSGALDRACGMFYTSDNNELESLVDQAIQDVGIDAFSCILAPISYFNEYSTTYQLIEQIRILKQKGVRHASIFCHRPQYLFYNRFENGEMIVSDYCHKNNIRMPRRAF